MARAALEILTIGDELLRGDVVDGNAAWLGRRLAAAGIVVAHRATVGDDDTTIRAALLDALGRTGAVLCTGGLGPTSDDRTKPVAAAVYGRALELDEALLAGLEAYFRARGRPMPAVNRSQAEVPAGARIFANPAGTAPGLALDDARLGLTILLPGVPAEVRALCDDGDVLEFLRARFHDRLELTATRIIRTTGIPESALFERVRDLVDAVAPVQVAFLPDVAGVDVRLIGGGKAAARLIGEGEATAGEAVRRLGGGEVAAREAVRRLGGGEVAARAGRAAEGVARGAGEAGAGGVDAAFRLFHERLADYAYTCDDRDLAEVVGTLLRERGLTLAVAESCTGGLLAKRLTDVPGCSAYVDGGVISYSDAAKQRWLGVRTDTLARHGAVSEAVALEMVEGIVAAAGTDCGASITGIAGPDGGTADKPVGTVWIGVSVGGRAHAEHMRFGGSRSEIRARAAQAALRLLQQELGGAAGVKE